MLELDDVTCGCDLCHGNQTISASSMGHPHLGRNKKKKKGYGRT